MLRATRTSEVGNDHLECQRSLGHIAYLMAENDMQLEHLHFLALEYDFVFKP